MIGIGIRLCREEGRVARERGRRVTGVRVLNDRVGVCGRERKVSREMEATATRNGRRLLSCTVHFVVETAMCRVNGQRVLSRSRT